VRGRVITVRWGFSEVRVYIAVGDSRFDVFVVHDSGDVAHHVVFDLYTFSLYAELGVAKALLAYLIAGLASGKVAVGGDEVYYVEEGGVGVYHFSNNDVVLAATGGGDALHLGPLKEAHNVAKKLLGGEKLEKVLALLGRLRGEKV